LQNIWGPLVAWYLFLAGAGAGAYMMATIASYMGARYQPIARIGVFLGAPLVIAGSLLLIMDLGKPTRFLLAFLNPQSSMISIGIILITVFIILGVTHIAVLLLMKKAGLALRVLGTINALFALAVACYTGMLLGMANAIPFWNTSILPVLFLMSALSTGIGAIMLTIGLWRWIRPTRTAARQDSIVRSVHLLSKVDIPIISVEILSLFFLLSIMATTKSVAAISANYLISGSYALTFWLGVVIIGLIVPLTIEAFSFGRGKRSGLVRLTDLGVITGLCLLVGGIALRYSILAAGMNIGSIF